MKDFDEATRAQVEASDPAVSVWLAANAGSGKTKVLTDRVARLLLAGVRPEHILCLTYTKAAASEMQNRLFERLGKWAMLPDEPLRAELAELGERGPVPSRDLARARTLFASAIDTPGGLKIQTIHAFSASILRRFPLEAGVTPNFTEMEERAAELLAEEIVEDMAEDPDDARALVAMAGLLADAALKSLVQEIARHRDIFSDEVAPAEIRRILGLPPDYDEDALLSEVFLGGEGDLLEELVRLLEKGSKRDQNAAVRLKGIAPGLEALEALENVLLTGKGAKEPFTAKIGAFPTKATRVGMSPGTIDQLEALMLRVEDARPKRLALAAARQSEALNDFARRFLRRYEAAKLARGLLDFDDLILKTNALLSRREIAQWVLYRLDGGIDHILVDEAQDTSPLQWEIIERLADEITAGRGRDTDRPRTLFVVGDRKQSIYSFQGADPAAFDTMREHFHARLQETEAPLADVALKFSFRSSPVILDLVDTVIRSGLCPGIGEEGEHRAFNPDLPGRVDLWPPIPKAEKPEPGHWEAPVDLPSEEHHEILLARHVAGEIARILRDGDPVWDRKEGRFRPAKPRDILVLVQRRTGALFDEIIRACKDLGVPMAGADRLQLAHELAVMDVLSLLSFLALPGNDLALAEALRSPLFDQGEGLKPDLAGWDEQRLFDLAHRRPEGQTLWQALQARADAAQEVAMLQELLGTVDFLRPFDLIERILTRYDGRARMLARLGPEAEDAIDALLAQALAYEKSAVPSLDGFLGWMAMGEDEVTRHPPSEADFVRVMTVHGAKGLEAPIVFLPDTAKRPNIIRDRILVAEGDVPLLRPGADEMPERLGDLLDTARAAQEDERGRLLYVAMTRAEQRLVVAAAGDTGDPGESWHATIRAAMEERGAETVDLGELGEGLSLTHGAPPSSAEPLGEPTASGTSPLPGWARQPPTPMEPAPDLITPSNLEGPKALPGEGEDTGTALAYGSLVHLCLEHLPGVPDDERPKAAKQLARRFGTRLDPATESAAISEAIAVLRNPALAFLFTGDSRAEVPVWGRLGALGGRPFSGVIDRLVTGDDGILIVDYKTNRQVPQTPEECPSGILAQLGAYRAALAEILPDQPVRTAVLWTARPELMWFGDSLVTEALGRALPA